MSQPERLWIYRARVVPYRDHPTGVCDGDTLNVALAELEEERDFGFGFRYALGLTLTGRLRLLGVNCPEMGTPEGGAAAWFTETWIAAANAPGDPWPLIVQTRKAALRTVHEVDHFGRYLGLVTRAVDGEELNAALVKAGMAVPYPLT